MTAARSAFLSMIAIAVGLGGEAACAEPPRQAEAWFRILSDDGQLIGIQHERAGRDGDGWEVSRETELAFRVEGHGPTVSRTRYRTLLDAAGRPTRIEISEERGGAKVSTAILLNDGNAHIERKAGSGTTVLDRPLRSEIPIVDPDALLGVPRSGDPLKVHEYDPSLRDFTEVELRTLPPTAGKTPRMALAGGQPSQILLLGFDETGAVIRATQPLLGNRVVMERAERPPSAAELSRSRTIPHQLVRAPYAIPGTALKGHIRYQFTLTADVGIPLPETGEQRVLRDGDHLRLDICEGCGPGLSTAPEDLDRWRQPTPWLQSDMSPLRELGARSARGATSERAVVEALGRRARARLKKLDYDGHYSALQAWQRKRGDCTEDAALLAALVRAAGIPARIASGVAYSEERYHGAGEAFAPHSWVVAYVDGAWQSFDISLGSFDTSHIAFAIGDGEPQAIAAANQLAGLLEWSDMAEVRKRPEN